MTADQMFWIEVEHPPRYPGDPLVALTVLMDRIGPGPFRLRAREQFSVEHGTMRIVYEAWPPTC